MGNLSGNPWEEVGFMGTYLVEEIKDYEKKRKVAQEILSQLPQWFGIKEAKREYLQGVQDKPFFLVSMDKEEVGFLSLKIHNPWTAEIYVMGIKGEYHRQGLGRVILERTKKYLRERNYRFLMVKTLGPSREDKNYQKTRDFYWAMGFYPLEEFYTLWDENNPCLMMLALL